MATPTYELLDSTTLASSASSVTFTSIDQSYGDLVLVVEAIGTVASQPLEVRFNSDSGSNYNLVQMRGDGSSTQSTSSSSVDSQVLGFTNTDGTIAIMQIMDYSATDKHTSSLSRNNPTTVDGVRASAHRWANTAAVTSVTALSSSNLAAGSTFHLYGIAK